MCCPSYESHCASSPQIFERSPNRHSDNEICQDTLSNTQCKVHGKPWKVIESHGRLWKGMEGRTVTPPHMSRDRCATITQPAAPQLAVYKPPRIVVDKQINTIDSDPTPEPQLPCSLSP